MADLLRNGFRYSVHGHHVEGLGVDRGKSDVDVRPEAEGDLAGQHDTARIARSPALVVGDSPLLRGSAVGTTGRLGHLCITTELGGRSWVASYVNFYPVETGSLGELTAEPESAAANIQGALRRGPILRRPIAWVTLGLVIAVGGAIPLAAKRGPCSADKATR